MSNRLTVTLLVLVALSLPLVTSSNYVVDVATAIFLAAFLGQAWNVSSGIAGQMSFGHTMFFGIGAYGMAILTVRYGINPYFALLCSIGFGAVLGWAVGAITFRFGLRGSYFALITLAVAEALRVLSESMTVTGGGVGILIPLDPHWTRLQFGNPVPFYYIALGLCGASVALVAWLKYSKWGAQLVAVRENEVAAQALGINVARMKTFALMASGALTATGGCFYVQRYLYVDPSLAFGVGRSVEMLLVAMVGGAGSVLGPLLGAITLTGIGEVTRAVFKAPGLSLVVYGVLLILVVWFMPRGLAGFVQSALVRKNGLRKQ